MLPLETLDLFLVVRKQVDAFGAAEVVLCLLLNTRVCHLRLNWVFHTAKCLVIYLVKEEVLAFLKLCLLIAGCENSRWELKALISFVFPRIVIICGDTVSISYQQDRSISAERPWSSIHPDPD